MNHLITENVRCCVCNGRGKVSRLHFWKRACHVCDGKGERRIIMDGRFPEDVKQQIRNDAIYGANPYAALNRPGNSLSNALFGGSLW